MRALAGTGGGAPPSCPRTSPSLLALPEEGRHHVGSDGRLPGTPFLRGLRRSAPDDPPLFQPVQPLGVTFDHGPVGADALDPGNDAVPVTDEDGLATLHASQVVAQSIFQLGDLDFHGQLSWP